MRILLVGALSWNPERVRSLCERGHQLWGLWSRSMAWEQGPYPVTDGCVRPVALSDAAATIREERIDCVYSLFQVYDPKLWGPGAPGVEHDVWTILRTLLSERQRGGFDAPIVRHWGFDVGNLDPEVTRALDGHIFCNTEKLDYWTTPASEGGCGLDLFGDRADNEFLDSDLPKLEFMNDRFTTPLSDADGEIHTVCVGRPVNIDYLAAARRGIHVHVYGSDASPLYWAMARTLSAGQARRNADLLSRFLHLHPPLQAIGGSWSDVSTTKQRWVEEFSRYDAGWSYVGSPFKWPPLDDRGAIPNRLGTYLLAGLPVIVDHQPGFYRYEELRRRDVDIGLVDSDYDDLLTRLEREVVTRQKRLNARERRHGYCFEATIDPLLGALEKAVARYFATPQRVRSRFRPERPPVLVHVQPIGAPAGRLRWLLGRAVPGRQPGPPRLMPRLVRRQLVRLRVWRLRRGLVARLGPAGRDRSPRR